MRILSLFAALMLSISFSMAADPKPAGATKVINMNTKGFQQKLEADITGAKELYLVVTDAGNGYGCDWADWLAPTLSGPKGTLKLTSLKWKSAKAEWGEVNVNRSAGGTPLKVNGKLFDDGIGTHANSVIHYALPEGYTKFNATAAIDNGGTDQNGGSSVQFFVYTSQPPGKPQDPGHEPEQAVAGLDVGDGLKATLMASEPMLLSPSNIDVDHLGRVWVCEVVNYRHFANKNNPAREAGDRIIVLEDTNGDAVMDKQTVFYQGRDIDSAHGVCVLGNRVIVSVGDSVLNFHDDNGDLKADRKEVMFTGIQGTQHDHGIHSFTFGPDGRLYFNFGNSGRQIQDADGKIITDVAGNQITANRQPYQEGMAFRCELDGSNVDTLGWNFRNNWELCVDSFGAIWQSDNDDDGNRGVRINFVMEYGNYGYKDELTGAGWRSPRTNLEAEIPLRHWHLNDPGVVPNLLQTGAGSPTGIICYEGSLLPKRFRNQLIHCDAGPNVVRSYAVTDDGAGYKAEINNILEGARDQWFRPSDVCVAPDGSLIVADWYDPGVGGHRQGDINRGRLFRVAPAGAGYKFEKPDFSTVIGSVKALLSPNTATRYLAFQSLLKSGKDAEKALLEVYENNDNPRFRARALWLLGQIEGRTNHYIESAIADSNSNIRIAGLRLARRTQSDVDAVIAELVNDKSPQVRRECAIALRHSESKEKFDLWGKLAMQLPRNDRWYLEALGIGAAGSWDRCLNDFLSKAIKDDLLDDDVKSRMADIIWRSRGLGSAGTIMLEISKVALGEDDPKLMLRFFRAMDFQPQSQVEKNLAILLRPDFLSQYKPGNKALLLAETLPRLGNELSKNPDAKAALESALADLEGTSQYVQLVVRFNLADRFPKLLTLAQDKPAEQVGVEAITALVNQKKWNLLTSGLRDKDEKRAIATAQAMGNSLNNAITGPLMTVVNDSDAPIEVRRESVRAASRVNNGAQQLIRLVESTKLDDELTQTVGAALHAAPSPGTREAAARLFPLPAGKEGAAMPPISRLITMKGDAKHGGIIFHTSGTCHKCHQVGKLGKELGPALTEIGSKLSRQAMYESILFPSAGISHNYESYTLLLTNGTTVSGLITSETDDSISIKGIDLIVRTFDTDDVEEKVKQKISLMPADLQKVMSVQDTVDVVEYLQTLKKK